MTPIARCGWRGRRRRPPQPATGSRSTSLAYAGRQVGLAEIALGDLDGLARISDPIPELERQRLLSAAAAHRSDLAGTLIELGRLDAAAAAVD